MLLVKKLKGWFTWWVKETLALDLRSLALFRITLAIVLIVDLCIRSVNLRAHYTDSGVLPRSSLLAENYLVGPTFSLHLMSGTMIFQCLLFIVAFGAALALLLGFHTRWATILCWLLLVSLHNRNPLILQGDDDIRRLLLFWGMFLPLGARWSIDHWLSQGKQTNQGASCPSILSVGTAALIIQVCLIYWVNALTKNGAPWHSEGTAIYYALSVDSLVKPFGEWLLNFPDQLNLLTRTIVPFELWTPWLLFTPFYQAPIRFTVIAAFVTFHIGLGLALALTLFTPTCSVMWIALLPSPFWALLKKYLPVTRRREAWTRSVRYQYWRSALLKIMNRSVLCAPVRSISPDLAKTSLVTNISALVGLFLILIYNYTFLKARYSDLVPKRVLSVTVLLRLDQKWRMFAPAPGKNDGWYVIIGKLANGDEVDLLRAGSVVKWDKPLRLYAINETYRWRQLFLHMSLSRNHRFRTDYARYLQRLWDRKHSASRQVKVIQVFYVLEETRPHFQMSPVTPVLMHEETFSKRSSLPIGVDQSAEDLRKTAARQVPQWLKTARVSFKNQ